MTSEEGEASIGIENKTVGIWVLLAALLLEQLVEFYINSFPAYFSLACYMKQIPDQCAHLTIG